MTILSSKTVVTIVCPFLCLIGCNKKLVAPGPPINACTLLESDEVEGVQGSSVTESKSSVNANRGLRVAQCYYAAKESSKSVVLTVTQRNAEHSGTPAVTSVWDEMFGNEAGEKKEREHEHEEGEEVAAPTRISDVGDEAYWTGARFGGALYVLKKDKDVFMRISVGGADTKEIKIEKSKALARKAYDRL